MHCMGIKRTADRMRAARCWLRLSSDLASRSANGLSAIQSKYRSVGLARELLWAISMAIEALADVNNAFVFSCPLVLLLLHWSYSHVNALNSSAQK